MLADAKEREKLYGYLRTVLKMTGRGCYRRSKVIGMISESRSHDLALAPTRCGSSMTDNTLPIAKNVPRLVSLSIFRPFPVFFLLMLARDTWASCALLCNCDVTNLLDQTEYELCSEC